MTRRAFALLMVLGMALVVAVSVVGLARTAAHQHAHSAHARLVALSPAILDAVDARVLHWLGHDERTIVLPPDATEPRAAVLSDHLTLHGLPFHLSIHAWDQRGMAPIALIRELQPDRAREADHLDPPMAIRPGLDVLRAAGLDGVFPGSITHEQDRVSIGARLSTYQRESKGIGRRPVLLLNTRTAPIELLAAVSAPAGVDAAGPIQAARSSGEIPTTTFTATLGEHEVRVSAQTDCWSFRIDLSHGPARTAWWLVYARTDRSWACVQALPIDE